jgi:hypothetical protein
MRFAIWNVRRLCRVDSLQEWMKGKLRWLVLVSYVILETWIERITFPSCHERLSCVTRVPVLLTTEPVGTAVPLYTRIWKVLRNTD